VPSAAREEEHRGVFAGVISWETFTLACAVGIAGGLIGLSLRYGAQASLDEVVSLLRGLVRWGTWKVTGQRMSATPWFCLRCHSVNVGSATMCYRGCGPRTQLEDRSALSR
jgi:hypothetical protein